MRGPASRATPAALLAALVVLGGAVAQDAPGGEALIEDLRARAREHVERGTVPGIQVALVEGGAILHVEGFGWADRASRREMTAATPINVGSISKSVAAWGFVRFCRREGLSLDTPVPPRVSTFKLLGPKRLDRSAVTIRRVLSHTAGLSTPSAPVFPADRSLPPLVAILEGREGGVPRVKLFREPGVGYAYSGGGYLLLQLMLEEATGESFSRFMAREVLEPAGMASSSFHLDARIRGEAASYYRESGSKRALYHLPGAAGALYSTAGDMGRWLTLYSRPSAGFERLLPEAAFDELLTPQAEMFEGGLDAAGSAYALGHATWRSRAGELYVFHGGGNPGLRAFYFVAPESGNGLFMVANHDRGQEVFRDLAAAWAAHYRVQQPPVF